MEAKNHKEEKQIEALLKSMERVPAPEGFTDKVMDQLSPLSTSVTYKPLISRRAGALIVLVLLGLGIGSIYTSEPLQWGWLKNLDLVDAVNLRLPEYSWSVMDNPILAYALVILFFYLMVQVLLLKPRRMNSAMLF